MIHGKAIEESVATGRSGALGPDGRWYQDAPGSTAWWTKQYEDLSDFKGWYGPPVFFWTVSLNATTPDILATWLAHSSRLPGNQPVDVFTPAAERCRLRLTGSPAAGYPHTKQQQPPYLVHTKVPVGSPRDDCPFHEGCDRQSIYDFSAEFTDGQADTWFLHDISRFFDHKINHLSEYVLTNANTGLGFGPSFTVS